MPELIINTTRNITVNEVLGAVEAEGNVHTEINNTSITLSGLNVHLCRIYTRLTGNECGYIHSPTILLGR